MGWSIMEEKELAHRARRPERKGHRDERAREIPRLCRATLRRSGAEEKVGLLRSERQIVCHIGKGEVALVREDWEEAD